MADPTAPYAATPRPVLVASQSAAAVRRERDIAERGDTRARARRPLAPARPTLSAVPTTRTGSAEPPARVMPGRPSPMAPVTSAPIGQPQPGLPPAGHTVARGPLDLGPPQPGPPPAGHTVARGPLDLGPPLTGSDAGPDPVTVPRRAPSAPGPTAAPPVPPGPPPYAPGPSPVAAPRRTRAVPLANPWRAMPAADLLKDLGALACLVLALLVPWNGADDGRALGWVVVAVAVAAVALAVPYLMISRLVPAFRPGQSVGLKAVLVLPVVGAALAAVVADLMTIGDPDGVGGVGIGVALALAGAMLVVQPRRCEEVLGPVAETFTANLALVVGLAAVVLQVVAFCVFVARGAGIEAFSHFGFSDWVAVLVSALALPLVLLGVPAVQHAMGRPAGRRLVAVVGFTVLAVSAATALGWTAFASSSVTESWDSLTGGAFVLGAAAGLALVRAAARRTGAGIDPATGWLQTARLALGLAGAGLALLAARSLTTLADFNELPASGVASTVLLALAALAAVCAGLLLADGEHRVVAAVLSSCVLALGVAVWLVGEHGRWAVAASDGLTPWEALSLFVLPGAALAAVVVPPSVRLGVPRSAPGTWGPPVPYAAAPRPLAGPPTQPYATQAPAAGQPQAAYAGAPVPTPRPSASYLAAGAGDTRGRDRLPAAAPTVPLRQGGPAGENQWSGWGMTRAQ